MISPDHVRLMARYNAWQNQNLYGAALTLDEAARRLDRGAFFKSIHGTLCHILWADQIWMSRLAASPKPAVPQSESAGMIEEWPLLQDERVAFDDFIISWADTLAADALRGPLRWYSGAMKAEVSIPLWVCITHMFNHQTHHRGQAHALLTDAGARPHDTDLFMMPEAMNAPA
jgi:uncharacterized damage-inducible protein DinB